MRGVNFSAVPSRSLVGKALRLPLTLIPAEAVLPILQGPLRGKKWVAGAGNHGCWLGSYEYETQKAFAEWVKPGAAVFDLGAHAGFYTMLASVLTGANGVVHAFEPCPGNVALLRRHLALNQLRNVHVHAVAVSDASGHAQFREGPNSSMGALAEDGLLTVRTVTLDSMLTAGEVPLPQVMKIDVEGAELRVLRGAQRLLRAAQPTLILSTHGEGTAQQCCSLLEGMGYGLKRINPASEGTALVCQHARRRP